MEKTNNIERIHENCLNLIRVALQHVEKDIDREVDKFYNNPSYKSYTGARNDNGYSKWKIDVIKRFGSQCCICLSTIRVVAHHLYSYKYYPELRTELNNGVCICNTCHELFNELFSNVNTLEQFNKYRKMFKGKSHNTTRKRIQSMKSSTITEVVKKASKKTKKVSLKKVTQEEKALQDNIVSSFLLLKESLIEQMNSLQKTYSWEKGIEIYFRNKKTTSFTVINKLMKEITRLNTLINCNKMRDKVLMAAKFHMPHDAFCIKLQDPKEYLNFTDSEITHLNKILTEDYGKEHAAERNEAFKKIGVKYIGA